MPGWLTIFLIAVTALLLRETVLILKWRSGRVLDLTHPKDRLQRRIVGLRLLAWLSLALAFGQRKAYQLGWKHEFVDVMTGVFLVVAVALVLATWYLRKTHGE